MPTTPTCHKRAAPTSHKRAPTSSADIDLNASQSARARRLALLCAGGLLVAAVVSPLLPLAVPSDAASTSVLGWAAAQGGILGLIVFQITVALSLGAVLSGTSYWYFFVYRKQRYNPDYCFDLKAITDSCVWAVLGITGGTLLAAPLQMAALSGWGQTYYAVEDYGLGYLALSVLLLLALTETLIYWIHRALHLPALFGRIHMGHHQFREPTPWAGFAFHPMDAFAQALPYHIAAFLFPLNIWVYTIMMSLVMLWAVSIHDRVSLLRFRWLNYAGHHTLHHLYGNYNFGQYLTLWDRIGGTYRCPSTAPDAPPNTSPESGASR